MMKVRVDERNDESEGGRNVMMKLRVDERNDETEGGRS